MAVESTMMPMTLSEIAETVGGDLVIPEGVAATPQTVATSAVTDSREVGEAGVFVAIAGERVDGHDFVGRAAQSGAAFVCPHADFTPIFPAGGCAFPRKMLH